MVKTGFADLPLHPGKCPPWLFPRMKKLGKAIAEAVCFEYGEREFLKRISNPFFFQSLGFVLAFDWHSSGLTTTTCGALKEGLAESDCGVRVFGGKGGASRQTPAEITAYGDAGGFSGSKTAGLVQASKLSAKVDSACVQDGFELYHHCFFASDKGDWAVVQQGMNGASGYARLYHWLSFSLDSFVLEPHSAICSDAKAETLDLTNRKNECAQKASVDLVKEKNFVKHIQHPPCGQTTLSETPVAGFRMPSGHWFGTRNYAALQGAYEFQPKNFEELLSLKGIGAKTLRGLALTSQLIYGTELDWTDPAKFSYSFGGKDGIPFPVQRAEMDEATEFIKSAVGQAKLGDSEKRDALKRLRQTA